MLWCWFYVIKMGAGVCVKAHSLLLFLSNPILCKQNHILPAWLHFVMLMNLPLLKTPRFPRVSPEPGAKELKGKEVKSPLPPSQFGLSKSGRFQAQASGLLSTAREMSPHAGNEAIDYMSSWAL